MNTDTIPAFPESLLNRIDSVHAEATAIFNGIDKEALKLINRTEEAKENSKKIKIK